MHRLFPKLRDNTPTWEDRPGPFSRARTSAPRALVWREPLRPTHYVGSLNIPYPIPAQSSRGLAARSQANARRRRRALRQRLPLNTGSSSWRVFASAQVSRRASRRYTPRGVRSVYPVHTLVISGCIHGFMKPMLESSRVSLMHVAPSETRRWRLGGATLCPVAHKNVT